MGEAVICGYICWEGKESCNVRSKDMDIKDELKKHEEDAQRMRELRPDIPDAIWDLEASEEMAMLWDEHNSGF